MIKFFQLFWLIFFDKKQRVSYGVSTDSDVALTELPRHYPTIKNEYVLLGQEAAFVVKEVFTEDERVLIHHVATDKYFELDIEFFEEFFTPLNPQENYPL